MTRCASVLALLVAGAPGGADATPGPESQPATGKSETLRVAVLRSLTLQRAPAFRALHRVRLRGAYPAPVVSAPASPAARSAAPPREASPAAALPRRVGWGTGESLTYRAYLAGVEIGRAALTVGSVRGRGDRVIFRAQGETNHFIRLLFELREELRAVADLAGLRPLRAWSDRAKGSSTRKVITEHGDLARQIVERSTARAVPTPPRRTVQRRRFAGHPFDPLTALYYLRSVEAAEGAPLRFTLLAGTALHAVELRRSGVDRLRTAIGPRECLRLEGWAQRVYDNGQPLPNKPRRRVTIWLTADALRIPVRATGDTDVGFVDVAIHSFERAPRPVTVSLAPAPRRAPAPRAPRR